MVRLPRARVASAADVVGGDWASRPRGWATGTLAPRGLDYLAGVDFNKAPTESARPLTPVASPSVKTGVRANPTAEEKAKQAEWANDPNNPDNFQSLAGGLAPVGPDGLAGDLFKGEVMGSPATHVYRPLGASESAPNTQPPLPEAPFAPSPYSESDQAGLMGIPPPATPTAAPPSSAPPSSSIALPLVLGLLALLFFS